MGWEVENDFLMEMGKQRHQLNIDLAILDTQLHERTPSRTTTEKTYNRSKRILGICKEVDKENLNNFDTIYFKDIISNAVAVQAYCCYFFKDLPKNISKRERRRQLNISRLLEKMYGERTFRYVEKKAREFNHSLQDRFNRQIQDIANHSYDSGLDIIRERIRGHLPEMIDMLKRYVEEHDLLPEEFGITEIKPISQDFDKKDRLNNIVHVDLSPNTADYSYWDGGVFMMGFDAGKLFYCRSIGDSGKSKYRMYDFEWRMIAIHEFIGHALQQIYSKKFMPKDLSYEDSSYNTISKASIAEGVSLEMERIFLPWIEKNRGEFGLSKKDIGLMNMYLPIYLQRNIYQLYYELLLVKERVEGDTFDARTIMAETTGVNLFDRDPWYLYMDGMNEEGFFMMNYIIGHRNLHRIMRKARGKYGRKFIDRNRSLVMKGLLLGSFRPRMQEEFFFTEYLPRVKRFIK